MREPKSRERAIRLQDSEVEGILAGTVCELRRPLKVQPEAHPEGRWTFCMSSTDRRMEGEFNWGVPDPEGRTFTERGRERQMGYRSPLGLVGDTLWGSEAWQFADWTEDGEPFIRYRADSAIARRSPRSTLEGQEWSERLIDIWTGLSAPDNYAIDDRAADRRWRASVLMPRWASRIALEITGVRIELMPAAAAVQAGARWAWTIAFSRSGKRLSGDIAKDAGRIWSQTSSCAQ